MIMLGTFAVAPLDAQKADTLLLRNGDRIIGEVKELRNGLLEYKTDNIGTIKVKWDRVVRLTSRLYFEVERRDGRRLFGSFPHIDTTDVLAVALDQIHMVPLDEIVQITRIKQTYFWDRIDGYLDLGFSLAKSNKTVQITSNVEATYLRPNWAVFLKSDLFVQRQNEAKPTRRWSIQPSYQRQLARRYWLMNVQGVLQQNQELGLDYRMLASASGGRQLVQTNRHEAAAFLGLAATHEWYVDSTQTAGVREVNNLEVSVAGSYRAFRYDTPELDFTASVQAYPSVSDLGRVRLEGDLRLRYELLKDFFVTLALQSSLDSRPPTADPLSKSDYTTTLALTWKF